MSPIEYILGGFLIIVITVDADIYLHNPRGSNNRLDEATRARTNANRMFDSQNNNRGGYNVGSLFYYQGSLLPIEWTNQHSCADANSHCEIILQYMCGNNVRDGATVKTIPADPAQCLNNDCNTDRRYGMHEDYYYYDNCKHRPRNKGLFTADQNVKKTAATGTRQNPGGTRRGYECPEERDYYPYWHPTPWKDIAIMTNDVSRCAYYQRESENVKSRWACVLPQAAVDSTNTAIPNNKQDCEKFDHNGVKAVWKEFSSHGLSAPVCRETEYTQDNHLGNGFGGHPNLFNWTVPNIVHEKCVLRIRYNVSTNDYDGWNTDSTQNGAGKIKMANKYGFPSDTAANARGYKFKNNPEVKLFDDADFGLRLAINTAQYGRVFQDRSHTFAVRPRPVHIDSVSTIHNVNVRGKRGNIVQVYPSVEYDFVPNTLEMGIKDYVHFQWTGSNTNNRGNDGNGLAGTDRNNIVLLSAQRYPEGNGVKFGPGEKYGHYGLNYPEHVTNVTFLGLGVEDVERLAYLNTGQFGGEMSQLDDAGTYFNLEPRQINQVGTYHYMCTRNNDFSNRDQKARVMVYTHPIKYEAIGWTGGSVTLASGAKVEVGQGVFDRLWKMRLEEWSPDEGERQLQAANSRMNLGDDYVSNFLVVYPQNQLTSDGKTFTVEMKLTGGGRDVTIYRSNSDNFATWTQVNANIDGDTARFQTHEGGVYVARSTSNIGLIVGIAVACIVVVVIIIGAIVYFRFHPKKWMSIKSNAQKIKRSTQNQI